MSGSFALLAPIAVSAVTVYMAELRARRTWSYYFWMGALANVLFAVGTFLIHVEGLICVVLAAPLFAIVGGIAGLIVGVITTIGFILCIIPGVIASIMLVFTVVALLDRNLSPVDAVKTSFDLSKANIGNVIVTRTPRPAACSTTRRAPSPYRRARRVLVFVSPIPE